MNDLAITGVYREGGDSLPAKSMSTGGGEAFLIVGRNFGMTPEFQAANPAYTQAPPTVSYGGVDGNLYTARNCTYAFGNTVVRGPSIDLIC